MLQRVSCEVRHHTKQPLRGEQLGRQKLDSPNCLSHCDTHAVVLLVKSPRWILLSALQNTPTSLYTTIYTLYTYKHISIYTHASTYVKTLKTYAKLAPSVHPIAEELETAVVHLGAAMGLLTRPPRPQLGSWGDAPRAKSIHIKTQCPDRNVQSYQNGGKKLFDFLIFFHQQCTI